MKIYQYYYTEMQLYAEIVTQAKSLFALSGGISLCIHCANCLMIVTNLDFTGHVKAYILYQLYLRMELVCVGN
jgi:hypothetical protein